MMGYLWMLFLFQVCAKWYEILVDLTTKTLDKAQVPVYYYLFIFHQLSSEKLFPLSDNGAPIKSTLTNRITSSFCVLNKSFNNAYSWCNLVPLNVMPKEQAELVVCCLVQTQLNAKDIKYDFFF